MGRENFTNEKGCAQACPFFTVRFSEGLEDRERHDCFAMRVSGSGFQVYMMNS